VGCKIEKNGEHGIYLKGQSRVTILQSRVVFNSEMVISKDAGCSTTCSGNVCTRSSQSAMPPAGFQFLTD
jgi:pyruvate/2-oxoacid:ferredoxin oxidoreductase beta subunit